jgi:hypothetical protein
MAANSLKSKSGTLTTGSGTAGQIDALNEVLQIDVEDLTNITLFVTQVTDNGTVTLDVEISPDGITWGAFGAAFTEASFAAANGAVAAPRVLEGTNGLPLSIKAVRIRASVYTGTGVYSLKAVGRQMPGYA